MLVCCIVTVILLATLFRCQSDNFEQTVTINGFNVDLSFNPYLEPLRAVCANACKSVRKAVTNLPFDCEPKLYEFLDPRVDEFFMNSKFTFGHGPQTFVPDGMVNIPFYNESFISYTNSMVKGIARVDAFRSETRALLALGETEKMLKLSAKATMRTVGSSTRIEGATLDNYDVAALLNSVDPVLETRSQQEVLGCGDLISHIKTNYHTILMTEESLLLMHHMLLRYSHADQGHKGKYKEHEVNVNAYDERGNFLYVVMRSTSPAETPGQVRQLLAWYNNEVLLGNLHPIARIAVFTVSFLKIHPFEDGNGRLSRALTDLLLLQSGYTHTKYSSAVPFVEVWKEKYYDVLQETQGTLDGPAPNWTPFLEYFVSMLINQLVPLEITLK